MSEKSTLDNLSLLGDGPSFRDELIGMIERAPMFGDYTRQEIDTVANYIRAYAAKKGSVIFREGDKGQFMCVVLEGRVDILKESQERELKKVAVVRPGKSMGEMSLLDDLPYSATAQASEDTTLLMLTKMSFEKLAKEQPALCNLLLRQLARLMSLRLRQTTGVLLDYLGDNK